MRDRFLAADEPGDTNDELLTETPSGDAEAVTTDEAGIVQDDDQPDSEPSVAHTAMARRLVEVEARAAILAEHGIPELLLPVVLGQLTIDMSGGTPVVQTIEPGSVRTPLDLVRTLKNDPVYSRAFRSAPKSGSGAPNQSGTGGGDTVSIKDQAALDRNVADIASGRIRVT